MNINLTIEIWKKGKWYFANCPELDFVSQGKTSEEAKKNLLEVIEIQFEEMRSTGTFEDYLAECGFVKRDNLIQSNVEMIGFEKQSLQVAC